MTEYRTLERCGKTVEPSGRPCMRAAGHYGNCLPGIIDIESSYDDYGEMGPESDYRIPPMSRLIFTKPMIIAFLFVMGIIAVQIAIDFIVLTR